MVKDNRYWMVFQTIDDEVHVVPTIENEIANGHALDPNCNCRPTPEKLAPLDEPVWAHNEPTWKGARGFLH